MAVSATSQDRYTIITADSHAGGSHAQYREFLEEKYLDDFDAWRAQYSNPYKDLAPGSDRRLRNWDDEMRNSQQDADGVVGEVIFPNTVPPFFPGFVLFAAPPKPEDYEHRLAGIRAHNRWLVDFCDRFPERRAGIGQIFMNDVDDAIDDVRWIKEHGLRGGVLIQPVPPDAHEYIRPLNDPEYDRLWAVCQDLDIPIQSHGGVGSPSYPNFPSSTILHMQELGFYTQRTLNWMILSGVFERFPRLKFVLTEQGGGWVGEFGQRLDALIQGVRSGSTGELRFTNDMAPPRLASEYINQNIWLGVSFASRYDVNNRDVVAEGHWMWGSDFPHDEATSPFTREHLRISMQDVPTEEKRKLLAGNAAAFYDFDLAVLDKAAAKIGPTVAEIDTPLDELPDNPNMALLGAGNTVGRARGLRSSAPIVDAHGSDDRDLSRIRAICLRFPEAEEAELQGRSLFRVRTRRFALFNGNDAPPRKRWTGFGRSLHFVTDPQEREALAHDPRFLASPHHGNRGWMALDLERADVDWDELTELLETAYRHVARRQLVEELDGNRDPDLS